MGPPTTPPMYPPGCQTYAIGPTPHFKAASLQSINTAAEKNSPPESGGIQ